MNGIITRKILCLILKINKRYINQNYIYDLITVI